MKIREDRKGTALPLALGVASLAACAGIPKQADEPPPRPAARIEVEALADALVREAERRVDTNALRVYVDELREARDVREDAVHMRTDHGELAAVGRELQRELVVALTSRLNLIDVDLARRTAGLPDEAPVEEVARAVGATHALVGTFSPRRDELEVLIRLVDAESLVIVAAASGVLAVEDLSDLGRLALGPMAPVPVRVVEIPARPRTSTPATRATEPPAVAQVPATVETAATVEPESPAITAEPAPTLEAAGKPRAPREPVPASRPVVVEESLRTPPVPAPSVPAPAEPVDGPALRRLRALGRRIDWSRPTAGAPD